MTYPEEIEEWLAVALAMIAGFLDAYGMITYHTYTYASRSPVGCYLGRIPDWRVVIGSGDTAFRRVGLVVPNASAVGAGGVRWLSE